jgi:hypothetical protein
VPLTSPPGAVAVAGSDVPAAAGELVVGTVRWDSAADTGAGSGTTGLTGAEFVAGAFDGSPVFEPGPTG